jgi:transposase-like protein
MRKSRLSKVKQDKLLEHFVAGTTACCASSLVGVNVKTDCYYSKDSEKLYTADWSKNHKKFLVARLKLMRVTSVVNEKAREGEDLQAKRLYSDC